MSELGKHFHFRCNSGLSPWRPMPYTQA